MLLLLRETIMPMVIHVILTIMSITSADVTLRTRMKPSSPRLEAVAGSSKAPMRSAGTGPALVGSFDEPAVQGRVLNLADSVRMSG